MVLKNTIDLDVKLQSHLGLDVQLQSHLSIYTYDRKINMNKNQFAGHMINRVLHLCLFFKKTNYKLLILYTV